MFFVTDSKDARSFPANEQICSFPENERGWKICRAAQMGDGICNYEKILKKIKKKFLGRPTEILPSLILREWANRSFPENERP